MLSTREILSIKHSNRKVAITDKDGMRYMTKAELTSRLWACVPRLVGLLGIPLPPDAGASRNTFFSVFHLPHLQTVSALVEFVIERHVAGFPVEVVMMSLEQLEFLVHWRDMAYARFFVQHMVECEDLDPLLHHQGMSASQLSELYGLDTALIVDLHHCYKLKGWAVPAASPRFILLENFLTLDDWELAPPVGMPKDVAWVKWVPRLRWE